jgi:cation diffusion facilitator CzcD-associated flavoprotein CzcO
MSTHPQGTESAIAEVEIAIIGSGLSGVGMAIALRRDGIEDFVVLERAADLGGTWRDNSYPGCACDIPSVLYSYRDEPNPDWTRAYAPAPEIRDYIHRVAAHHDVERFMRYGHELLGADFDAGSARWELETRGGRYRARTLISAVGALADPSIPDLPGLSTFAGTVFHSARWNHEHDLRGRRVAVIGTGASAIQFVPEIQPEVGRLTLFQRTPPWVLPRGNPSIPESMRRRFARHPSLQRLLRRGAFSVMESTHLGFQHPALMKVAEHLGRDAIAKQVPDPALQAKLIPDYSLGCKRVLQSDAWYPALVQDNVDVVTEGIRELTPDGVVDRAGVLHEVDTIIFGTGFHVTDLPIAERIRGRAGRSLADVWGGSMQAHLGIDVPGFPNLFFLLGPNTGLGHNSVLLMIEAQIAYIRQALAHRERSRLRTLEPTPRAQRDSIAEIDRGTRGSVWTAGGCISWYVDKTGRNSTLWPGSVRAYQRRVAHFEPRDYTGEPVGVRVDDPAVPPAGQTTSAAVAPTAPALT